MVALERLLNLPHTEITENRTATTFTEDWDNNNANNNHDDDDDVDGNYNNNNNNDNDNNNNNNNNKTNWLKDFLLKEKSDFCREVKIICDISTDFTGHPIDPIW